MGLPSLFQILLPFNHLMQLLMGLNDTYDHVRKTNKAYSMILHVEKQQEVHVSIIESSDSSSKLVRLENFKSLLVR